MLILLLYFDKQIILENSSKIDLKKWSFKDHRKISFNISIRLFARYVQTTLVFALITADRLIHHEIMVQVSYVQYKQLEWAWRSMSTNIFLTKISNYAILWILYENIFFLVRSPSVYVLRAHNYWKAKVQEVPNYHSHNTFVH